MTLGNAVGRVTDMVRQMMPHLRPVTLSPEEVTLGIMMRGNDDLYNALKGLIEARLRGRFAIVEPSDPVACKTLLARDGELRWLLGRLEAAHRSPVNPNGEQPE